MRSLGLVSYLFLLLSLALAFPRPSNAKESVTWMEVNMPPQFIQDGPQVNQGYGDVITAILKEQMPEYEHYEMVTNVIRHFNRFKQGEQVCTVGLYKTAERESFMHFSMPCMLVLPPVLIIRKDKLATFDGHRSVRLDDILQNKDFIIGLGKDRSYGTDIDTIIKKYPNRNNLLFFTGQELTTNFFKMLLLDRIDGLIGTPDEIMFQAEKMGIRDKIATLTIEENQHNYAGWLGSVGCSKTEWGRNTIDTINKVLLKQRPSQRFRAAYERWLDANSLETYRKIYQQVFLHTTQ
jgi:uncharacterized protein (TIGR02285 family)